MVMNNKSRAEKKVRRLVQDQADRRARGVRASWSPASKLTKGGRKLKH